MPKQAQTKAPSAKKATTPDDPYRSGRNRFSWQQIRRGRDRKWHFAGQQSDEVVRLVVRKHWWFLVTPALPFFGTVALFILSIAASITLPQFGGSLWLLLQAVLFILMVGVGIWFAYKDLVIWWINTYIITNKRIIASSGLLQPTRKEISMDKVQQIGINVTSLWGVLLGYGNLHLYLAGSDFEMEQIPNPKRVKDIIDTQALDIKSKKEKPKDPPVPKNPTMAATLEELAKARPVPKLPDADEQYPAPRDAASLRGPRRTFGGILRIRSDVRYESGEYTVKYVQRSQYVLLRNLALPILSLIALLMIGVLVPTLNHVTGTALQYWLFFMGIITLCVVGWMALIYTNYADDVYILTNRRIIDIQRHFIFFYETRLEAQYKNIRDTKVKVTNVIERLLDVGDVYVETPGNNPDIILTGVDHPFVLLEEIQRIRTHKEKEDAIVKENNEKKNLHMWFGTVVTRLESTVKSRGAPDLKGKDLISAIACARQHELEISVTGEARPTASVPPGCVVSQNPPEGTLMASGSKIEITLSKRM